MGLQSIYCVARVVLNGVCNGASILNYCYLGPSDTIDGQRFFFCVFHTHHLIGVWALGASAGGDGVLGAVITLVCSLIGLHTLVSHHHDLFCGPRAGAGGVERERLLS